MEFSRRIKSRSGFSLIELLVVISIIALLAALLFPLFTAAKRKSHMVRCSDNLKQLHQAVVMYADDHDGFLPRICNCYHDGKSNWNEDSSPYFSTNTAYYDLKHYIKNTNIWQCPAVNPNNPENYTYFATRQRNDIDYRFNVVMNNTPRYNAHPGEERYYTKRLDVCTLPKKFYLVSDRHSDRHFDYDPNVKTNWIMLMIMADGHIRTDVRPYNNRWLDPYKRQKYAHWDFPDCHIEDKDKAVAAEIYRDNL